MSENIISNKPWYKKWWIIAIGVVILLIILGNLGGKKTPTDSTNTPQAAQNQAVDSGKTYQPVFTFSGSGAKKSEPFTITGNRFKIKYSCTNTTLCSAYLYKVGKQLMEGLIVNTNQPVTDETIYYGSGEYYIDASMMVGNYTMTVEDYK